MRSLLLFEIYFINFIKYYFKVSLFLLHSLNLFTLLTFFLFVLLHASHYFQDLSLLACIIFKFLTIVPNFQLSRFYTTSARLDHRKYPEMQYSLLSLLFCYHSLLNARTRRKIGWEGLGEGGASNL